MDERGKGYGRGDARSGVGGGRTWRACKCSWSAGRPFRCCCRRRSCRPTAAPPAHHAPAHSLNYSPTHPLTQLRTLSPTYSMTYPLNHSLNYSPTHSLTQLLAHPLTDSLTHTHPLALTHSLAHWLSLSHSIPLTLTHSPTLSVSLSLSHPTLPHSLTRRPTEASPAHNAHSRSQASDLRVRLGIHNFP